MKIHEATYETCGECSRTKRCLTNGVYGCDQCRKRITRDLKDGSRQYLQFGVFTRGDSTKYYEVCSWKCFAKFIREVKSDYFISLPYLLFDTKQAGIRAKDFLAILKK